MLLSRSMCLSLSPPRGFRGALEALVGVEIVCCGARSLGLVCKSDDRGGTLGEAGVCRG